MIEALRPPLTIYDRLPVTGVRLAFFRVWATATAGMLARDLFYAAAQDGGDFLELEIRLTLKRKT